MCMACTFMEGPVMEHSSHYRYRTREIVEDVFIVLAPPIVMLISILWFFRDEWVPTRGTNVLMYFVDSFLALLTSAV